MCGMIFSAEAKFDWKAQTLFNLYDVNKSTTLSLEEMIVLMTNSHNALIYMTGDIHEHKKTTSEISRITKDYFAASD